MSKINEVKSLPGNVFEWTVRLSSDTVNDVGNGKYGWKSVPFRVPCNPCNDNGYHLWVMKLRREWQNGYFYYSTMSLSEPLDNSTVSPSGFVSRFRGKMMKLRIHSKLYFHNANGQPEVVDNICMEMATVNNFSALPENVHPYHLEINRVTQTQSRQIMFIMTCEVRFNKGTYLIHGKRLHIRMAKFQSL